VVYHISPSKLILGNWFRFQLIKNQQNCSNLRQLLKYEEGRPHFRKLIIRSIFLMYFKSFINECKSKTIFKLSFNSYVYWDTPNERKAYYYINNNNDYVLICLTLFLLYQLQYAATIYHKLYPLYLYRFIRSINNKSLC